MKIYRHKAVAMADALAGLALSEMDSATIETTMMNYDALRKAKDDFSALQSELFKRLYGDVEKMQESEKKPLQEFFNALGKVKDDKGAEALKTAFPALYEKREKEMQVLQSLLNKELEIDLQQVDERAFVAGIVKGNRRVSMAEVKSLFAPMFVEQEKQEADLSELDELLTL